MTADVAAHVERTRLAPFIVAALLKAGLVPPTRDTVDRIGYSAQQVRAILPSIASGVE